MTRSALTGDGPLDRAAFLRLLQVGLLIEEDVVAREYGDFAKRLQDGKAAEFVRELVLESATHKGELLDLIEQVEAMKE